MKRLGFVNNIVKIALISHAAAASAVMIAVTAPAAAQQTNQHHGLAANAPAAPFVASTAKPFSALMNDAMSVMDDGMRRAPMWGVAEHDFVTMMIPHHQGAIDMAKALLLYTKDPELKNLAQGIITEQQNEINLMQAWIQHYQAQQSDRLRPAR
jgi:uncharacterized protein (DUF305 family)